MSTSADNDSAESTIESPVSPEGPNENTFWAEYSPRHEFPTSLVGSIFLMACLFALIAAIPFFLGVFHPVPDKSPVPMIGIDGGFDEAGEGTAGSGGVDNPVTIGDYSPSQKDIEALPQFESIPEVTENLQKKYAIEDPNSTITISPDKARAFASLDKSLQDKMAGVGSKQGVPGGPGAGTDPAGAGAGGTGASSTRERTLRWILRFRTTDGRDYLNQLSAVGATILVPLPPDNKRAYIFRDLTSPKAGEFVSDNEWKNLDGQIRFCDYKRDSVAGVASALNLDFTPHSFWAFFPKGLEEELSRKEVAYANRRPEDIAETVFEVVVRGGRPTITVAVQKMKR